MKNTSGERGFIRTIIIIVVALLILSYFGFNIRTIVNSPTGKDNFTYTQEIMISTWNNILKKPVTYLWNDIFVDLIWNPTIGRLTQLKGTDNTNTSTTSAKLISVTPLP